MYLTATPKFKLGGIAFCESTLAYYEWEHCMSVHHSAVILSITNQKYFYFRKDMSFSASGRRAFSPNTPADINLGNIVKFSRQGGRISRGVVRYLGHLPGKNDTYLGVELEQESKYIVLNSLRDKLMC